MLTSQKSSQSKETDLHLTLNQ